LKIETAKKVMSALIADMNIGSRQQRRIRMKIEDAINAINNCAVLDCRECAKVKCPVFGKATTAWEMVLDAARKQIPKEPLNKQRGPYGWYGQCPGCGQDVLKILKAGRCEPCGQALKWD
jgi:hypothetical protein